MLQILFALAALITYGSLYPFELEAADASTGELVRVLTDLRVATSRGDIVGNVLLFLPYGFVTLLAAAPRVHRRTAVLVMLASGAMLAVALQVAQIWVPGRVPAIGDAVLNVLGMLLGFGTATLFRRKLPLDFDRSKRNAVVVPLSLALLWVAYRWFPLVPTVDLQNLKEALKPLFLGPFEPARAVQHVFAWLAFFRILLLTPVGTKGLPFLGAAAILIVAGQAFFAGNTLTQHAVAGLVIALACMPLLLKHYASSVIVGGLLVSLLLDGLRPYALAFTASSFNWLPFSGFLDGNMASNAQNLLYKGFFYGATVFLLRDCGSRPAASAITVAVWLAAIEAMQVWVPSRTAEVTDPLLALLIGWILHLLNPSSAALAYPRRRTPPTSPRIAPEKSGMRS